MNLWYWMEAAWCDISTDWLWLCTLHADLHRHFLRGRLTTFLHFVLGSLGRATSFIDIVPYLHLWLVTTTGLKRTLQHTILRHNNMGRNLFLAQHFWWWSKIQSKFYRTGNSHNNETLVFLLSGCSQYLIMRRQNVLTSKKYFCMRLFQLPALDMILSTQQIISESLEKWWSKWEVSIIIWHKPWYTVE